MIPNDAVDAAQRALYSHFHSPMLSGAALRLVLEAAAPFMLADAWLDGYRVGEVDTFFGEGGHEPADLRNPYRSQERNRNNGTHSDD